MHHKGALPAVLASKVADPDAQVRGPLQLEVHDLAVETHRSVPVRAYVPVGSAPCPVVVFSPGLGGSRTGYRFLAECWASHGYAVLVLEHPGTDGSLLRVLGGFRRLLKASEEPAQWEARALDVRGVLDALPSLPFAARLDAARVGVGGHSFGAFTSLLVADVQPEGCALPLGDARPRAFAVLSAPGYGSRGIAPGAWSALSRPLLAVTGTLDVSVGDHPWTWRTEPFLDLPPGDKWLLVFADGRHQDFAGGTVKEPAPPALLAALEEATLAFWDATLRDDARAASLLSPHALDRDGVRVHVDHR